MWPAIEANLKPLPPDTRVWVGHEYTIANLTFALSVDKDNAGPAKMVEWPSSGKWSGNRQSHRRSGVSALIFSANSMILNAKSITFIDGTANFNMNANFVVHSLLILQR